MGPRRIIVLCQQEARLQDPEVQQLLSELYAGKPLEMHVRALEKHVAHCKDVWMQFFVIHWSLGRSLLILHGLLAADINL